MRTLSNFAVTAIGAMVLALTSAGPGSAQTNFYEGKQIRIVVASAAATSYDLHARLVARFLPKYIPGNPTIIVQAMPGRAASSPPITSSMSRRRTAPSSLRRIPTRRWPR